MSAIVDFMDIHTKYGGCKIEWNVNKSKNCDRSFVSELRVWFLFDGPGLGQFDYLILAFVAGNGAY